MDKHEIIRRDSPAHEALCKEVTRTANERTNGRKTWEAWKEACQAFHGFESPMFRVITDEGLNGLSAGDPELVDWGIAYLEVDPYHFRSGYYKSWIIRRLKRVALTDEQVRRLQVVVLHVLDNPRRAMRYYSRLAACVQSPRFLERLGARLDSDDPERRQRAQLLLEYIETFNRSSGRKY